MRKIFLLLLLVVGLNLAWQNSSYAQIFIEEGKIVLPIKPGERLDRSLIVHNTTDQPVKVRAYWEDFLYVAPFDAAKKFLPAGTSPYSFFNWAKFTPASFVLPPFGKKKVDCLFIAPPDIKGGYYGVLFFENDSQEAIDEKGVRIVARVGCLFFLETKNKVKKGLVNGMAITDKMLSGKLINKGNVILIASPVFYMMNAEGVVVDRGEVKKIYLPPGETGEFSITLKDKLPKGKYTTVMTFDLQDGAVVVKEVDFVKGSTDAGSKIVAIRD